MEIFLLIIVAIISYGFAENNTRRKIRDIIISEINRRIDDLEIYQNTERAIEELKDLRNSLR